MNLRKNIIRAVTFLGGLYFVLEFVLPASVVEATGVSAVHDQITYGFISVGAMAFGLGLINLFMVHGAKILYLRRDWFFSLVLLVGLLSMGIVSSLEWWYSSKITAAIERASMLASFAEDIDQQRQGGEHVGQLPVDERFVFLRSAVADLWSDVSLDLSRHSGALEDREPLERVLVQMTQLPVQASSVVSVEQWIPVLKEAGTLHGQWLRSIYADTVISKLHVFMLDGLFNALGAAMFSLLSVYIAAAAFRAFRIKSWESSLMMLAAVVVILGQTPFGLWIWEGLPAVRQWLMEVPNSAAFRAIKIGSAVAGLVMAFRMWLSIESESFS